MMAVVELTVDEGLGVEVVFLAGWDAAGRDLISAVRQ